MGTRLEQRTKYHAAGGVTYGCEEGKEEEEKLRNEGILQRCFA
jgi:hypothetical protein